MGKKYIIELEDKPFHKEDGDFLYRVKGFNSLVFDMTGIGKLTPYTEPDLGQVRKEAYKIGYEKGYRDGVNRIGDAEDKIRKEAYEEGYKTAKIQCGIQAEKDLREVGERHYQRGLSDAWEAARKVVALSTVDRRKVFGSEYMYSILEKHTASEAIAKIKEYEDGKQEIKVGDEVITASGKAVVIGVWPVHFEYFNEGGSGFDKVKDVKKTGRHFPEIAAVLEKMRGEQDGERKE